MKDRIIFVIDEAIINCMFSSKNEEYTKAQLFFDYIYIRDCRNKTYMIPSLFSKIIPLIGEDKESTFYFKDAISKAKFIGDDSSNEKEDTLALYQILAGLYDDKVIIISDKFSKDEDFEKISILSTEELNRFLNNKKDFMEYICKKYGIGDYDGTY